MNIESVKATGKYVSLKMIEIKNTVVETKTKTGIILQEDVKVGQSVNNPNVGGKIRGYFVVESVGPDVDLDKYGFKIGDEVIFNDYDSQTIGDSENTWVLCKADNIKAVVVANK